MRSAFLALALLLAVYAAPAAANPPTWDFQRASFGIDAKGSIIDQESGRSSAFVPGAYLAYSATSALSLNGTIERDFASKLTSARAGLRFLVMKSERGQLGVGANLVGHGDEGAAQFAEPTSWEATLNGSWTVLRAGEPKRTVLAGIASVFYDEPNRRTEARVGLRWQIIGGRPSVIDPD